MTEERARKLDTIHHSISRRMAEIRRLFEPRARLTVLIRYPEHPDGSRDIAVAVTDDSLEEAIAALARLKQREDEQKEAPHA